MKIFDLSHTIDNFIQVFPGSPSVRLEVMSSVEEDGIAEKAIHLTTHVGTHVDVPAHLLAAGETVDTIGLDRFVGKGFCLSLAGFGESVIHRRHLEPHAEKIREVEFLLLATGRDKWWGDSRYLEDYPVLSRDAADFLISFPLKGVGVDTISVDPLNSIHLPIHNVLLKRMVVVENLTGLHHLPEENFLFSCLPLKIAKGDGSPVRAVAIFI